MVSESEALLKETLMPVYVAPEDEQLLYMYEEVKQAAATRTSSIFVRGERSQRVLYFVCLFISLFYTHIKTFNKDTVYTFKGNEKENSLETHPGT